MPQRTTLTLDDDVADRIAGEVRRTGQTHRAVVNAALRRGLDATSASAPPFRIKASPLGRRPEFDLDSIEEILDRLDGPMRR